jgi:hypothetical protein
MGNGQKHMYERIKESIIDYKKYIQKTMLKMNIIWGCSNKGRHYYGA